MGGKRNKMEKGNFKKVEKILKSAGYRKTIARKMVLDILSRTKKHLSTQEIYQKIYKKYPSIGMTTIYRTLELFTKLGIVSKYDFGDGRSRYELKEKQEEKKHHHHLICIQCNKVIDYTDFMDEEVKMIEKLEKAFSEKYKFEIKNHQIFFYGLCEKCRKNIEKKQKG